MVLSAQKRPELSTARPCKLLWVGNWHSMSISEDQKPRQATLAVRAISYQCMAWHGGRPIPDALGTGAHRAPRRSPNFLLRWSPWRTTWRPAQQLLLQGTCCAGLALSRRLMARQERFKPQFSAACTPETHPTLWASDAPLACLNADRHQVHDMAHAALPHPPVVQQVRIP